MYLETEIAWFVSVTPPRGRGGGRRPVAGVALAHRDEGGIAESSRTPPGAENLIPKTAPTPWWRKPK